MKSVLVRFLVASALPMLAVISVGCSQTNSPMPMQSDPAAAIGAGCTGEGCPIPGLSPTSPSPFATSPLAPPATPSLSETPRR